jgi:large subunit ribosomal protein L30
MFFVIRVRGSTGVIADIKDTLDLLNLTRISHAVLVEENPSMKGMLQKAKDNLTWGEIDGETLTEIIEKRGKLVGGDKVTEEYLKENTDFSSFEELANALINAEIKAKDINMKPVFRLHPPRKGYESIRLTYNEGGTLGYRGEEIIDLAKRMS